MQFKKTLICSAIVSVGAISFSVPAVSESQKKGQEISLLVGHNVVDAVDDLRETTADLIGAILEAEEGLALKDWKKKEAQLNQMEQVLEQMEVTLDRKAEATDSSWLNWLEDPDYSVTVKDQISTIGRQLETMASMLSEATKTSNMQVVVGHNLVDQIDDVRETTGDLFNAISSAGPQWGWFDDNEPFTKEMAQLDQMEQTLDKKAEMTDADWGLFVDTPEYRVTVHQQINALADMVNGLANRISTDVEVSKVGQ